MYVFSLGIFVEVDLGSPINGFGVVDHGLNRGWGTYTAWQSLVYSTLRLLPAIQLLDSFSKPTLHVRILMQRDLLSAVEVPADVNTRSELSDLASLTHMGAATAMSAMVT